MRILKATCAVSSVTNISPFDLISYRYLLTYFMHFFFSLYLFVYELIIIFFLGRPIYLVCFYLLHNIIY